MTSIQERKLSMYLVVNAILKAVSTAISSKMPKFNDHAAKFDANVTLLQQVREQQETGSGGLAVNKQALKTDLVSKAMGIARKLKAFAVNTDDAVLTAEVAYTESDLLKSADTILRDKCQVIYTKADAHLADLADYGLTAGELSDLKTAVAAYLTAIPQPKTAAATKKQVTARLNQLFKDSDAGLDKLDVLAEMVKNTEPAYYQTYSNGRKLTAPGYRKLPVRGQVKDAGSLLPLSGVVVRVEGKDLKTKTTAKGNFQLKDLDEGMYVFTFEKNGYQPRTLKVAVTNGERTDMEVSVEKTA
ncbi:MAG: carboxypeptidase regulatory-like domain-containing protein [Daejeonella sp.]